MSLNKTLKVFLIIFSLPILGGVGCVTLHILNSIESSVEDHNHARDAKKLTEDQQAYFKRLKVSADSGDLAAKTELGFELLSSRGFVAPDKQTGMAYLDDAVSKSYGPAEFMVGTYHLLSAGIPDHLFTFYARDFFTTKVPVYPADIDRGLALLKLAAKHTCKVPLKYATKDGYSNVESNAPTKIEIKDIYMAENLSDIYKADEYFHPEDLPIKADPTESLHWMARSILHCQYPNAGRITGLSSDRNAQEKINTMALIYLMDTQAQGYSLSYFGDRLTEDEKAAAKLKAEELRLWVKATENEYPAFK